MEKVITFLKKNKQVLSIILLIIVLLPFLFNIDNAIGFKTNENQELKKQNIEILKEIKLKKDSMQILYEAVLNSKLKDTVYINQIRYLKTKSNEEVNNIPNLSVDSNLNLFTRNSEEFIRGFSEDSL